MKIVPFSIHLNEAVLTDLFARLRNTRWPPPAPGVKWAQGTDLEYLKALLDYWANTFNWRAQELQLNAVAHFQARLDGNLIHFVHERARYGQGIPLILTHGWPSSFIEFLPLIPLLTNPRGSGISGPAFDVVIPSLPGYGFSERPAKAGVSTRTTAKLWHQLMNGLGYHRYGAHGTDFGAGVSTFMALDNPAPVIGLHLSNLENSPHIDAHSQPLSAAEQAFINSGDAWFDNEGGYKAIQRTRPQTLAYGLNDSPAGLAAWILEKWRSWSDSGGNLDQYFSKDMLLTMLTLFWATQTITTSMRDYADNHTSGYTLAPKDFVTVPTGIAGFTHQYVGDEAIPREWAERIYNVQRWTPMPRGGHFAAVEEPELLARDIVKFFDSLTSV